MTTETYFPPLPGPTDIEGELDAIWSELEYLAERKCECQKPGSEHGHNRTDT